MNRISWDEYYMRMIDVVKLRSTCLRHKFGAIVTIDNQLRGTGYNGAPHKQPHCTDIGCLRDELSIESGTRHEICRAVHAEQNAILRALEFGSIKKGTLYVNAQPCHICARFILNSGITRVVYVKTYSTDAGVDILRKAGIETVDYSKVNPEFKFSD
jgi:dCMP deaminase